METWKEEFRLGRSTPGKTPRRGLNLAEGACRIADDFVKTWYAC